MGVDYDAYAIVGLHVEDMEGTEFHKDFYAIHESGEDEPEDILGKKYGVGLYYFNRPYSGDWEHCYIGYDVGGDDVDKVSAAFNKFKDKFGVEGKLQAAMVIW